MAEGTLVAMVKARAATLAEEAPKQEWLLLDASMPFESELVGRAIDWLPSQWGILIDADKDQLVTQEFDDGEERHGMNGTVSPVFVSGWDSTERWEQLAKRARVRRVCIDLRAVPSWSRETYIQIGQKAIQGQQASNASAPVWFNVPTPGARRRFLRQYSGGGDSSVVPWPPVERTDNAARVAGDEQPSVDETSRPNIVFGKDTTPEEVRAIITIGERTGTLKAMFKDVRWHSPNENVLQTLLAALSRLQIKQFNSVELLGLPQLDDPPTCFNVPITNLTLDDSSAGLFGHALPMEVTSLTWSGTSAEHTKTIFGLNATTILVSKASIETVMEATSAGVHESIRTIMLADSLDATEEQTEQLAQRSGKAVATYNATG